MSKKENKTNPVFFSFSWPQDGEQSFLHLHFCPFTHKRPKILRKQNKGYKWRHRQVDPCVFETGLHTVTEQNKAEAGYGNVCIYVARCSGRSKRTRNLGATKTSKTSFSFFPPSLVHHPCHVVKYSQASWRVLTEDSDSYLLALLYWRSLRGLRMPEIQMNLEKAPVRKTKKSVRPVQHGDTHLKSQCLVGKGRQIWVPHPISKTKSSNNNERKTEREKQRARACKRDPNRPTRLGLERWLSICCSCRGHRFSSQHPHKGSQLITISTSI